MAFSPEDQELIEGFLLETAELLDKLDDDLVQLEKDPANAELLNRIFRSIHTVKGSASFLGFEQLVAVTHKGEDVLNRLRKGELTITPQLMDTLLLSIDMVKLLIDDIRADQVVERQIGPIVDALVRITEGEASTGPVDETPAAVGNTEEQSALQPADKPALSDKKNGKTDDPDNNTVRIDTKRLDDLMNQVGELVLERNRMVQLNDDHHAERNTGLFSEELSKLTKRLSFVTTEIQAQVMKMRMIPVEKVFKKFPRIVRGLARDLGKEVELEIFGEETELDRSIVDQLADPLVHLIRNALDHGLELPADRVAAGKSRQGTLTLGATHEGNHIVISIADNGKGVDTDKVARKAMEKGLVTQEQLDMMTQKELLDLIFLPGFSTMEVTSDLSGRGVGMDVVKTNIKKMNGIIDIRTEAGHGSEFLLRLPLTLAIIQALMIDVCGEIYSIPLSSVIETIRIEEGSFRGIGFAEVMTLRNEVLPLVRLERLFGAGDGSGRKSANIVVVGIAEKKIGIIVDRLLGQQEVAIKSLGTFLGAIKGVAGSTILGDGRVALIIDPAALIALQ